MKKAILFILSVLCAVSLSAQGGVYDNKVISNQNKPERAEWLRDLGLGFFMHWEVDTQLGVSISHSMVGASDDYMNRFFTELPQTFDPYKYDPYRIALQAKMAGCKYICLTAKHHSGFCLWDTKTTDFNIMNTPYGKDLLKEYIEGARKAGLAVGLYYSPEDFKYLYDHGYTLQRPASSMKLTPEFEKEYHEFIREQTRELFTQYGDIDMLFIDGLPKGPCLEEAWKLQPDVVITRGAVNTPEQKVPGIINDSLWESCITMGRAWQYQPTDEIKSTDKIVKILVETRAKGGNLLLNVGPKPDGTIADPEERRLMELTAWHFVNQEAIHNVRPWIISHEDNIWFTASKDKKTLYAIIEDIPDWKLGDRKDFVLTSVKTTPETEISVLGQNSKVVEYKKNADASSRFSQEKDGVHISVCRAQRLYDKWTLPVVVKLENIEPALVPPIFATEKAGYEKGKVILNGVMADMAGKEALTVGFEWRESAGFNEAAAIAKKWNRSAETIIKKKGDVKVALPAKFLKKGKEYEYRMVVYHPEVTLYGERVKFSFK